MWPALNALFHRQMANTWMERPHVIRVREAKKVIGALVRRKELCLMAKVPLPKTGCRVAQWFQGFGDRDFIGMETGGRFRPEIASDADSCWNAAGQQGCP